MLTTKLLTPLLCVNHSLIQLVTGYILQSLFLHYIYFA